MKPFMSSSSPIRLAQGRLQRGSIHSSLALAALLLSACGDDITEQINANVGAVKSSDELPACTEDIAGQTAFIKETHEFLGCDGSEWQSLGTGTVSVGDNVCMSKSLSDGSGFEIFCNGESIGTVKNGEKGEKGDDGAKGDPGKNGTNGINGTGCEITESSTLTATIACGSETFTMDLTGYVEQSEECDAALYEDCTGSLDNVQLSGVSQKGPFVTGTDITAYELENGRSLKQTGKTFGGKIEREDGTFDIKTVKLKSTFAYLVADGFYRNEVTGENSASTIKLRALTNLQGRTAANINLVTHLEYDRVQRLVTKQDSSVLKAKMAAEKEIFAAFGIDNTGFKGFAEDFNILEKGDGNAALLAISVLLQGDRNESELTSLLAALSVDLGDNGKWDNEKQRTQVADWAMKKDLDGGLATIRKNIKTWKLRDSEPPAFESHVTNFWMTELGVGECANDNAGALFAIKNKKSAYYAAKDSVFTEGDSSLARLICDASGDTPAWRFATDLEKDTLAFAVASEGSVQPGSIDTTNIYVKEGSWRHGTELDMKLDFGCVGDSVGAIGSLTIDGDVKWFICDDKPVAIDGELIHSAWRAATTAEADTAGFGLPDKDTARVGNVHKSNYYVYEMVDGVGKWRYGTELDVYDDLGPCTQNKLNVVARISKAEEDMGWYRCASDWAVVFNGEKLPHAWREATTLEADTAGINARAADLIGNYEKIILKGNMTRDSLNYYVHVDGDKWRRADTLEMDTYDTLTHMAWSAAREGDFKQGAATKQYYVYCDAGYQNGSIIYRWRLETSPLEHDPDLGGCTYRKWNKIAHKKVGADSLHYVCLNYLWQKASSARLNTEGYSCSSSGHLIYEGKRDKGQFYACDDTFRVATKSEMWAHNILPEEQNLNVRCGPRDNGKSIELPKVWTRYVCRDGYYEWDGHPVYTGFGSDLPEDAQGNQYEMVAIGTQFWIAHNLRIDIEDAETQEEVITEDSLRYYGRLYRYDDAVQACEDMRIVDNVNDIYPTFRLPSVEDWKVLLSYETDVDGYSAAQAYKSKNSWERFEGDNKYLFTAVPAGDAVIESDGTLLKRGIHRFAEFWTSDTINVEMSYIDQKISMTDRYYNKEHAETEYYSVRCLGDVGLTPPPKNPNKY